MAGLPHFDSCCCGLLPLRTGTLIAGIVCLVMSLGSTGRIALELGGIWPTLTSVVIILCLISSILLIIGVLQENTSFMKFFIIVWVLSILFTLVLLALYILAVHDAGQKASAAFSVVVMIAVVGYCVCIANSYFSTLTGVSAIQTA